MSVNVKVGSLLLIFSAHLMFLLAVYRAFSEYLDVLLYMMLSNQHVLTRAKETVTKLMQTSILKSMCVAFFWFRVKIQYS